MANGTSVPREDTGTPYRHQRSRDDNMTMVATRTEASCGPRVLDFVLLMVFPSEPMARVAAIAGGSRLLMFCAVSLLYFGAVACFAGAHSVSKPVFIIEPGEAMLIGWFLVAVSPMLSLATLTLMGWGRYMLDHEDEGMERETSETSISLLAAYGVLHVALAALAILLCMRVVKRMGGRKKSSIDCVDFFCPSCTLMDALHRARMDRLRRTPEPNELPAYTV